MKRKLISFACALFGCAQCSIVSAADGRAYVSDPKSTAIRLVAVGGGLSQVKVSAWNM